MLISVTQNYFLFRESIHSKFGKTNKFYKRDVKNPNHGKFLLLNTNKINSKNIKMFDYERATEEVVEGEEEEEEPVCEVQAEEFFFTNPHTSDESEAEVDMEITE